MMYQNKFVAVLKVGRRVLRERDRQGDSASVFLPFGTEYTLAFKNLHTQRAVVSVTVDGQDVLGGRRLLIPAYNPNRPQDSEYDLERFVDRLDKGNRFRFIQKTQEISENRGDKLDDGLIRISWQYEEQAAVLTTTDVHIYHHHTPRPDPFSNQGMMRGFYGGVQVGGYVGNAGDSGAVFSANQLNVSNVSATASASSGTDGVRSKQAGVSIREMDMSYNSCCELHDGDDDDDDDDAGITVKGSVSNQQFKYATVGALESTQHVIVFSLHGTDKELNEVVEPLTTKTKLKCPTCGQTHPSNFKFCPNCTTALAAAV